MQRFGQWSGVEHGVAVDYVLANVCSQQWNQRFGEVASGSFSFRLGILSIICVTRLRSFASLI